MTRSRGWRFWIDRGGTFTDLIACDPDGRLQVRKVLSEPARGVVAPAVDPAVGAIRAVLGLAPEAPLPAGLIEEVRLGTTVATNALLERQVEPVLLLVNRGLADLITIGDQHRPALFALQIVRPASLPLRVLEVAGRLGADGSEREPLQPDADLVAALEQARRDGFQRLAVALLHSTRNPAHELALADWLAAQGWPQVLLSHQLTSQPRLVPRLHTTAVEAAIRPVLRRYLDRVQAELGEHTRLRVMTSAGVLLAPADLQAKDTILSGPSGGLLGAVAAARAAGVQREPLLGFDMGGTSTDVFHLDGATGLEGLERHQETRIDGLRVQAPMLPIHTVAAGGGSVLQLQDGRLLVGPRSAGADPGPLCYRRGGPLTVTDANLLLGRLPASALPPLFGPGGDQPADAEAVRRAFEALAAAQAGREIGAAEGSESRGERGGGVTARDAGGAAALGTGRRNPLAAERLARGALDIANERMAEAIRRISIQQGHDLRQAVLVCYGGAGGQHACALATILGLARVLVHPLSGVLSAWGIGQAPLRQLQQRSLRRPFAAALLPALTALVQELEAEARRALERQVGGPLPRPPLRRLVIELRPAGSERGLELELPLAQVLEVREPLASAGSWAEARPWAEAKPWGAADQPVGAAQPGSAAQLQKALQPEAPTPAWAEALAAELRQRFEARHRQRFGYAVADEALVLERLQLELVLEEPDAAHSHGEDSRSAAAASPSPRSVGSAADPGRTEAPGGAPAAAITVQAAAAGSSAASTSGADPGAVSASLHASGASGSGAPASGADPGAVLTSAGNPADGHPAEAPPADGAHADGFPVGGSPAEAASGSGIPVAGLPGGAAALQVAAASAAEPAAQGPEPVPPRSVPAAAESPRPSSPELLADVGVSAGIGVAATDALASPPPPLPAAELVPLCLQEGDALHWRQVPLWSRQALCAGHRLEGPALVVEATGVTVVEPHWSAVVLAGGLLVLERSPAVPAPPEEIGAAQVASAAPPAQVMPPAPPAQVTPPSERPASQVQAAAVKPSAPQAPELQSPGATAPDPVQLELYNHRFSAIATQMGVRLQQSSRSVNIRERLDFSCALFDREGRLVANAPHIPVHLGSMGESVRALRRAVARGLLPPPGPGDAVAANNPYNGGTHLPDITVITPVFAPADGEEGVGDAQGADGAEAASGQGGESREPLAYVACRGHHADVGGITPGSMPPFSRSIAEEGLLLDNVYLLRQGRLLQEQWRPLLAAGPHPVRDPEQLLADLQAQVAANRLGVDELHRLMQRRGRAEVCRFMEQVQIHAAEAVRRVITRLRSGRHAVELDDGSRIAVQVQIDRMARRARVDFSGTSPQQEGNGNAPLAITRAVVLYVFRCLVGQEIPLNAGCFAPIELVVPEGCLLHPRPPAAVVAGNVETSQAVANALFAALGVMAAAQGTMNNLSFGNGRCQYYETICGGSGAGRHLEGEGFDGASAVQTHMTNSRLTDPEILEERFPVLLERFAIRRGSGGRGRWCGGDGVERWLRFLEPMTVSLLTGARRVAPAGLAGGGEGAPGRNALLRADGHWLPLQGRAQVEVQPGDLLCLETPGGGGYGHPAAADSDAALP